MASVVRRLQLTLALVKPDCTVNPLIEEQIKNLLLSENFLFVKTKTFKWTPQDAEHFYRQHAVVPITGLILCRQNAISHWRELMGPTKVYRAIYEAPDSVRGLFGLTDTRNSTHGSDSDASAAAEIATIFPSFDVANWYEMEEPKFRLGPVQFNNENGIHEISVELVKSQLGTRNDARRVSVKELYHDKQHLR